MILKGVPKCFTERFIDPDEPIFECHLSQHDVYDICMCMNMFIKISECFWNNPETFNPMLSEGYIENLKDLHDNLIFNDVVMDFCFKDRMFYPERRKSALDYYGK